MCRHILDDHPEHAPAARLLSEQLIRADRQQEAIDVLSSALGRVRRARPRDIDGLLELTDALGAALERTGRPADAADRYQEMLDLRFSASGAVHLARCQIASGRFQEAFVLLSPLEDDAVERGDSTLLVWLARAMRAVGREDPATDLLARTFELDPDNVEVDAELEALGFYVLSAQGKAVLIPAGCATPPGIPLPSWARPG